MAEKVKDFNWPNGFTQGYACAIANIIRDHGHNGLVNDAIIAGGLTKENMEKRFVDPEDMKLILSNKGW